MVGVKKLNEMRVNPCRSVVNNLGIVKIKGWEVQSCETELDERNLNYWSSGNRHKEGRSFTRRLNYGTGEASFVVLRKNGITSNEQAKEYQYTKGVAD